MKSPHESDGRQLPIVLADDEPATILLVKTYLHKAGYTTYTCGNGRDALNLVTEHNPVILLADWMMPEPTGVELCRTLRASPSHDFVYRILVTANDDPSQIATGLDAGADDYLIKPVRAPVLLARVRLGERVLRLRIRQDEHARELESEIAERRQVARKLLEAKREAEQAQAETRQLFEAITSVLIGVDGDGRVTAWNTTAERTLGIGKGDAVGRLFDEVGIDWDQSAVAQGVSKCLAGHVPIRVDDVSFKRPDGTNGFLGITLSPLRGDSDDAGGFLFVAADVTEHMILQGQLAQAQKLESIGQLAAGIAHEINTPIQYVGDNVRFLSDSVDDLLRLIGSFRDILSEVANGADREHCGRKAATLEQEADLPYLEEELPKSIAQSLEGVGRVSTIVRAMKEFSHPAVEGKEVADLNKAIESTVTVARNEWKYVADVVTEFDPSLPLVSCHLGEFNQIILNIVINAAHAIADVVGDGAEGKGTITLTTRRDGDWAEIRIRDTGSGIPEKHRTKVFDHFFTTKEVGKGTGQGLAIAYAVVTEKHGGTITFETEMGKGTTFIIRLPIEPETTRPEETPQHEEAHSLR